MAQIRHQFAWLPKVLRLVAVPAMALLWWALAFLPWTRAGLPSTVESWPPTLPLLFTDLVVAVFGPLGASLVVVALVRRAGLAFLSVLLGFVVSAWVALTRGAGSSGYAIDTTERLIMLAVCGVAALAGLAVGAVAIRSLQGFGFLGLLAVPPVASLAHIVVFGSGAENRWLTRSALVALLVVIAWRRWTGVLMWPIFFVLFWLLNLAMSAVGYGAETLRHPGGSHGSVGTVAEAMLDYVRSAWRVLLETSWDVFWPAVVSAALVAAGVFGWRLTRHVNRHAPDGPKLDREEVTT